MPGARAAPRRGVIKSGNAAGHGFENRGPHQTQPATPIADTENVVLQGPLKGSLSVQQAPRRDAPVRCEACGRTVIRRSRQQRFCSDRCRDFARRENKARTAFKNPVVGEDTGKPTNPPKKSNGFNGLQTAKSGSNPRIFGPRQVIERELFGGREWHEEVSPHGVVTQVARLRRSAR